MQKKMDFPMPYAKINSKLIKTFIVSGLTFTPQKKTQAEHYEINFSNVFLVMSPQASETNAKTKNREKGCTAQAFHFWKFFQSVFAKQRIVQTNHGLNTYLWKIPWNF